MRVHVGTDHAGLELARELIEHARSLGHDPVDHSPTTYDPEDDYPPYILRTARAVAGDPGSLGIVLGGSGNGEAIAANKVAGIRAALVWSDETARLAREHNDANVIALGARTTPAADAVRFVTTFLATPFSQDPRHVRRIAMLARYEATGVVPEG